MQFAERNSDYLSGIVMPLLDEKQSLSFGKYDLQQCTGLRDKNNKLIFEGDIIKEKWFSKDSEQYEECLYVAEYSQKHCAYCLTEVSNGYKNFFVDMEYIQDDYEIIGNIYENKELLGGANES